MCDVYFKLFLTRCIQEFDVNIHELPRKPIETSLILCFLRFHSLTLCMIFLIVRIKVVQMVKFFLFIYYVG